MIKIVDFFLKKTQHFQIALTYNNTIIHTVKSRYARMNTHMYSNMYSFYWIYERFRANGPFITGSRLSFTGSIYRRGHNN
jgi:hypothetical protein